MADNDRWPADYWSEGPFYPKVSRKTFLGFGSKNWGKLFKKSTPPPPKKKKKNDHFFWGGKIIKCRFPRLWFTMVLLFEYVFWFFSRKEIYFGQISQENFFFIFKLLFFIFIEFWLLFVKLFALRNDG